MTGLPPAFSPEHTMAGLEISLGQFSSAGTKHENQDFHGALCPEGADLVTKGIAVAIADGISTSRLGAQAAETAVKTFLADYYCTSQAWSVRTSGERVIAAANSWMHAQNRRTAGPAFADEERETGLVCTFTALVLKSRSAHVFHIGDCRVARIGAKGVEPLTEDHRVWLGGGVSYLGRALGVNAHVEIDYLQLPVREGETYLVTSDGVHDVLADARVLSILSTHENLDAAARALADAALEAGSNDNLTVQIVRIESLPEGSIGELIETALPPAPLLAVGDSFEGFAIEAVLHSGSRSHVYRARDTRTGESVALKVLSTEHAEDPAAQHSLLLEEWVMRRVEHANLLSAPPPPRGRAHAYSVSALVEGQGLDRWMLDNLRPELARVRDVIRQVASGLQALHRREMIHRDLRPYNVLIDGEGHARIIDFGSVQVAGLDELAVPGIDAARAGTMQYSAPELYLGYAATRLGDQFSLGVIAYQLLTGELPYGPRVAAARTRSEQRKLRYTPVTAHNPDVPDWMDAAVAKAVSIDPANRYDELFEFVIDLEKPNPLLAPASPAPLLDRGSVRTWKLIAGGLALALAVSIFTRAGPGAPQPQVPPQPQQETAK